MNSESDNEREELREPEIEIEPEIARPILRLRLQGFDERNELLKLSRVVLLYEGRLLNGDPWPEIAQGREYSTIAL